MVAIGIWVTIVVYVAIAAFARSQLREARALRVQQHRPYVIADVIGRSTLIYLCFRNIGATQALGLQIGLDEQLVSSRDGDPLEWQQSPVFTSGMPSMAPKGQIRFFFDTFPSRKERGLPMTIAGRMRYRDVLGNRYDEPFLIDLDVYGPALQAEKDMVDLVNEVKALRTTADKWTDGNRGIFVSATNHRREMIESERPFHLWKAQQAKQAHGWRGVMEYYVTLWRRRSGWYTR
jgi:hypothetical protein